MINLIDLYKKYVDNLLKENEDYFCTKVKDQYEVYSLNPFSKNLLEEKKRIIYDKVSSKNKRKSIGIRELEDLKQELLEFDKYNSKNNHDLHKVINENLYKEVIKTFINLTMEELIKGKKVSFGKLGHFIIHKVKKSKNIKKLKVDWAKTREEKARLIKEGIPLKSKDNLEGAHYIIYHSLDEPYYCVTWRKYEISNISCYKFIVANKSSSKQVYTKNFKNRLIEAFKNPIAALIYKSNLKDDTSIN